MKDLFEEIFNDKQNLIINGDISSGKTLNLLMPITEEMILREESIFIVDPKKEYLTKYYDELKSRGYKIIIFNLRDFIKSDSWNPLDIAYKLYKEGNITDSIDIINNIGEVLYPQYTSDQFWANSAINVFKGIVINLFEDALSDQINFKSIEKVISSFNIKYKNSNYLKEYIICSNHENSKKYLKQILNYPQETLQSIMAIVKQGIEKFTETENMNKFFSKTSFDMNQIAKEKTAIFFITRDENKIRNEIASLFIDQLFQNLVQNDFLPVKFNFVLDNFDTLTHIPHFDCKMSSGIPRNIKFVIGTRSYKRMTEEYSKYISRLSDYIKLDSGSICIIHNSDQLHLEIPKIILNEYYSIVEYPVNSVNQIDVFDVPSYFGRYNSINSTIGKRVDKFSIVEDEKPKRRMEKVKEIAIDDEKSKIDKLVKLIDEKIYEVEQQSKLDKIIKTLDEKISSNEKQSISKEEKRTTKEETEDKKIDKLVKLIDEKIYEVEQQSKIDKIIKSIDEKLSELEEQNKIDKIIDKIDEKISKLEAKLKDNFNVDEYVETLDEKIEKEKEDEIIPSFEEELFKLKEKNNK